MQQIFVQQRLTPNQDLVLAGTSFRHLIKVLRLQVNDYFWIVDKQQQTFQAQITTINSDNFQVHLQTLHRSNCELPVTSIIACSLSKKDKLDWITQKATELGAQQIVFFRSRYSIMKWAPAIVPKKLAHLQQIALSAAQQSHRLQVPQVKYYATLADLIKSQNADYQLVAYEQMAQEQKKGELADIFQQLQARQSLMCLFGPEGGFAVEEIRQLRQNKYKLCGLGPRILRAETAPLYFLSALSYQTELEKELIN